MSLSPLQVYRAGEHQWAYWRAEIGRWVVGRETSLDEPGEGLPDEIVALMQRATLEPDRLELALLSAADEGHGRRSSATFAPREDGRPRAARARRVALVR